MGIVLYLLAVLIEIVSAIFRYLVGSWLGGPLLGYLLAGLPFAWSLLTLLGVPSDYLTSLEMGARRPSQRERDMVEPELTAYMHSGIPSRSRIHGASLTYLR